MDDVIHKEMKFLFRLSRLVEENDQDLTLLFSELVHSIPLAMTCPEECYVRLRIRNDLYESKECARILQEKISHEITLEGKSIGEIIVGYPLTDGENSKRITEDERILILYLCERLGRIIERFKKKQVLEEREKELQVKSSSLRELLLHIEDSRKKEQDEARDIIDNILLPHILSLEKRTEYDVHLEIVKTTLQNMRGERNKYLPYLTRLTPKEREICQHIKNGLSSKEIGQVLAISPKTIERHRANIRKKMCITGTKDNLKTVLGLIDF